MVYGCKHTFFLCRRWILLWGMLLASVSPIFSVERKEEKTLELSPMVVTGTKNLRFQQESPIAVEVISSETLQNMGATELSQALAEVSGMQIVYDHGEGVQLEGFDSDYVLILVDGEPVIGRTSGTFDINRINLQDVERIEIVPSPLSSQYGSSALAGTINIITKNTTSPLAFHSKWSSLREKSKDLAGESFQSVRLGHHSNLWGKRTCFPVHSYKFHIHICRS